MGVLLTEDTTGTCHVGKNDNCLPMRKELSNKKLSCPKPILPLINTSKATMQEGDRAPGHSAMGCHNLNSAKSRAHTLQGPAQDTASLTVRWAGSHITPQVLEPHLPSGGKHLTFHLGKQTGGTDEGAWSACSGVAGGPDAERSEAGILRLSRFLRKSVWLWGKWDTGEPNSLSLVPSPS